MNAMPRGHIRPDLPIADTTGISGGNRLLFLIRLFKSSVVCILVLVLVVAGCLIVCSLFICFEIYFVLLVLWTLFGIFCVFCDVVCICLIISDFGLSGIAECGCNFEICICNLFICFVCFEL